MRLPEFSLPDTSRYLFSISFYRSGVVEPNEGLSIYASTSPKFDSTAVLLEFIPRQYNVANGSVPAEATMGMYAYSFLLPSYENIYIYLVAECQAGGRMAFDDLSITRLPDCSRPYLDSAAIGSDSIRIEWTGSPTETYSVYISGTSDFEINQGKESQT